MDKSILDPARKPKKASAGQKEMLMPIAGKKPAKEVAAKKPPAGGPAEVGLGTETREAGSVSPLWEARMDMNEVSAMTEASGLTDEQGGLERASVDRSNAKTGFADGRATPPTSQYAAVGWAERLREVTAKAPLQLLLIAFLLGIWFARRR